MRGKNSQFLSKRSSCSDSNSEQFSSKESFTVNANILFVKYNYIKIILYCASNYLCAMFGVHAGKEYGIFWLFRGICQILAIVHCHIVVSIIMY